MKRPDWKRRRLLIHLTLLWCLFTGTYLVGWAPSDALREQAFIAIAALAGSTLGAYVFGATWDDRNYMRAIRQSPKKDEPAEPQETD